MRIGFGQQILGTLQAALRGCVVSEVHFDRSPMNRQLRGLEACLLRAQPVDRLARAHRGVQEHRVDPDRVVPYRVIPARLCSDLQRVVVAVLQVEPCSVLAGGVGRLTTESSCPFDGIQRAVEVAEQSQRACLQQRPNPGQPGCRDPFHRPVAKVLQGEKRPATPQQLCREGQARERVARPSPVQPYHQPQCPSLCPHELEDPRCADHQLG